MSAPVITRLNANRSAASELDAPETNHSPVSAPPEALSLESLQVLAFEVGDEDVLNSFCDRQLKFIVEQDQSRGMNTQQVYDRLKLAIFTYKKETEKLEKGMDKELFKKLLLSGDIIRSGNEKGTNRQITWFDTGCFYKSMWKYRLGSPQGKAWVRAMLFVIEGSHSLAWSVADSDVHPVFYGDDANRGLLDFNLPLLAKAGYVCQTCFPAEQESVRMTGLSTVSSLLVNFFMSAIGGRSRTWTLDHTLEGLTAFVEDPADIPEIWGGERLGEKPFSPLDPRQRWLIDRILDGSGGLTLKDVLNPGPWPHAEFNFSFHRPEKDQFEGGLEAIEEGDDDDEDW